MCDVKKELIKEISEIKEVFDIYKDVQKANMENIQTINKSIKFFKRLLVLLFFIIILSLGILIYNSFNNKTKTIIGNDNITIEDNFITDDSDIKINGQRYRDLMRTSHKNKESKE